MSTISCEKFLNPEKKYRSNIMLHVWPEERGLMMDAINAFGYGGVVTNPPFAKFSAPTFGETVKKNNYFCSPESIATFGSIVDQLEERNLAFWIYDEEGYPSGYASGMTLEGHPEYEGKGVYMRRRVAYQPTHIDYHIDDQTDKIVFAGKYPIQVVDMHDSFVQYDKMEPVPFTETSLSCDLAEREALFIFCVKSTYEGSQCTHNTCSFDRQIALMNKDAVRRFIELVYEPIAKGVPGAFSKAISFFTDEPSLMTCYTREYECWDYALMPWVDGITDEFEKEYGFSLLPYLPLLFEGDTRAYSIRTQYYRLVGKLVARAYTKQLADFCHAHGGAFGGHYLGEELIDWHTRFYGSFLEVIKEADYVGIDMLRCYPEFYTRNSARYAQMALRKNGKRDLMVEFCPFAKRDVFNQDHFNNALGTLSLLYLDGAREVNCYYYSDLAQYPPLVEANAKRGVVNAPDPSRMTQAQGNYFNEYLGRFRYMLDGLINETGTVVYYALEDAQATCAPIYSYPGEGKHPVDLATMSLTYTISDAGHDYLFADDEDILLAAASAEKGSVTLYGNAVKTVLVPACDVMYEHTYEALARLKAAGVHVIFCEKAPTFGITRAGAAVSTFPQTETESVEDVLAYLDQTDDRFTAKADGAVLRKARYTTKEGKELYLICNSTRGVDADALLIHKEKKTASVYNPIDGSVTPVKTGDRVTVPSFRGIFVLFD